MALEDLGKNVRRFMKLKKPLIIKDFQALHHFSTAPITTTPTVNIYNFLTAPPILPD